MILTKWACTHVHFVGDIVDAHNLSFHDHDPDMVGGEDEAAQALAAIEDWVSVFPTATACVGNHDARHIRKARRHGIPTRYFKDYSDLWHTPGWKWSFSHILDGVAYEHGEGTTGKDAALNRAIKQRRSAVIGHTHTYAGVKWHTSKNDRVFGLNAGCGIDVSTMAFHYAKPFVDRPVLGCGVVLEGQHAYFEVMECGPKEKYRK